MTVKKSPNISVKRLALIHQKLADLTAIHENDYDTSPMNERMEKLNSLYQCLNKHLTPPAATQQLQAAVGEGGVDHPADVRLVKELLNQRIRAGFQESHIELMGAKSIAKIKEFQRRAANLVQLEPTGRIEPGDAWWQVLISDEPLPLLGEDGGETYLNQRDDVPNQQGAVFGTITGDITCFPNSIAMQLIDLANGDEAALKEQAIAIGKDSDQGDGQTIKLDTSMQFSDMLTKLSYKFGKAGEKHEPFMYPGVMSQVAAAFKDVVGTSIPLSNDSNDFKGITIEEFMVRVRDLLNEGKELTLSTKLTKGHIVKVVAYVPEGLIIHDPYGLKLGENYLLNGTSITQANIDLLNAHQPHLNDRLQHNQPLKTTLQQLVQGFGQPDQPQTFPTNLGARNFFNWGDIKHYNIGFGRNGVASSPVKDVVQNAPKTSGVVPPTNQSPTEPAWISEAFKHKGEKETAAFVKDDPFVSQLFAAVGLLNWTINREEGPLTIQEGNWCAAFVSFCLKNAGVSYLSGFDGIRALKYKDYGPSVEAGKVVYGAIAVFRRDGGGHVGFVVGRNGDQVDILGGNQGEAVTVETRSLSEFEAQVVPSSWTIPPQNYLS